MHHKRRVTLCLTAYSRTDHRASRDALRKTMTGWHTRSCAALIGAATLMSLSLSGPASTPAAAQQQPAQKPNILFIMGDDIGWMQPSIYHRGLMVGETPNIDRIGNEGAIFMHYYAEQSCTAGRNAFFTGMHPLRTGMIPPQLPGQPVLSAARHAGARQVPARSRLQHRRVRQEPSRRSHRRAADRARLPGILGLSLSPRCDAGGELPRHQQDPDRADHRSAVPEHADPGLAEVPGAVDPRTTICLTPPRPVLSCKSSDGTAENQTCRDEGPLTLERSKTVDEEISAKVVDFLDRNDPRKTNKPFFVWYNPARMHITTVFSPQVPGHDRRARRQGLGHQRSRHEADGRQHRRRAQEARGHGPAQQHDHRVHDRQRRRGDHLPGWRRHARSRAAR